MFTPKLEKIRAKAIKAETFDAADLHAIQRQGSPQAQTASLLEALGVAIPAQDHERARGLLDWLVNSNFRPEADES